MKDPRDKPTRKRYRSEPRTVAATLGREMGPIMRQVRKFAALRACLAQLPDELDGLAAPYDLRLLPAADTASGGKDATVPGTAPARDRSAPDTSGEAVSTLLVYVLGGTVEAAVMKLAPKIIEKTNAQLPYPVVEGLRCEQASKEKIARQVNILRQTPD